MIGMQICVPIYYFLIIFKKNNEKINFQLKRRALNHKISNFYFF